MKQNNYYRRITELLPKVFQKNIRLPRLSKGFKKNLRLIFGSRKDVSRGMQGYGFIFLFLLFILLSYLLLNLYNTYKKTVADHAQRVEKLSYWEGVLKKHPNFVDAYYSAALEAARLKENNKAIKLLDKALFYDPLFKEAIDLKKELEK